MKKWLIRRRWLWTRKVTLKDFKCIVVYEHKLCQHVCCFHKDDKGIEDVIKEALKMINLRNKK